MKKLYSSLVYGVEQQADSVEQCALYTRFYGNDDNTGLVPKMTSNTSSEGILMKSPVPAMAKIFTQGEYGRITQKGFYDYNQLDTGGE